MGILTDFVLFRRLALICFSGIIPYLYNLDGTKDKRKKARAKEVIGIPV
jgi:hypothetical protein